MTIPTTYLCWGCGSEVTGMEPQTEPPIPEKTVWNVCPDCRKSGNRTKNTGGYLVLVRPLKVKHRGILRKFVENSNFSQK